VPFAAGKSTLELLMKNGENNRKCLSRRLPGPVLGFQRTVICVSRKLYDKNVMFPRGGIAYELFSCPTYDPIYRRQDTFKTPKCPCLIPIKNIKVTPTKFTYSKTARLNWRRYEEFFFEGKGIPLVRTSNLSDEPGYVQDKVLGPDLYRVEMMMNCSRTYKGYF